MPKMMVPPGYQGNGSEVMLNPWMAMAPVSAATEGLEGALGYTNEFIPWKGAKDLMSMGRNAVEGLKRAVGGFMGGEAQAPAPIQKAAQIGYQSLRQPKPGGVLYDVLERAGVKSGTGQTPTPGEGRLLDHFSSIIKNNSGRGSEYELGKRGLEDAILYEASPFGLASNALRAKASDEATKYFTNRNKM